MGISSAAMVHGAADLGMRDGHPRLTPHRPSVTIFRSNNSRTPALHAGRNCDTRAREQETAPRPPAVGLFFWSERNVKRLEGVRHLALDLDGTLYLGGRLFPFTIPFLERV